ncbi:uncharacterized protein LOC121422082 [Lytechinus variegatus]|uniref:uncharacterized protein LOC121422082 n=1 Tax=Lytechinus variegatus TaxID=7654 RepID=UPI001BB19DCA|nr:uncharacterized protein LOC121422082 [Lytechinus variegatus]
MAEKAETSGPPQSLICPLCLDIFVEAVILPTCGHTYCRRCLKNIDLSTQSYHMTCPVCRKKSKFTSAKCVDDFPANVTVNAFVDDYHARKSETRPKCNTCRRQWDAELFCKTCDRYLCERCVTGHQEMAFHFEGHETVAIEDVIDQSSKKDCTNEQEDKKSGTRPKCNACRRQRNANSFCKTCHKYLCKKCVSGHHEMAFLFEGHEIVPIEKKPEQNLQPNLGSNTRSDPKLNVIKRVTLPAFAEVWGMTRYSDDSVGIPFGKVGHGAAIINSDGREQPWPYPNTRNGLEYFDLIIQEDRSLCVSTGNSEAHVYSPDGSKKSTIHVNDNGKFLTLNRSPSDEIIISNAGKQVYIYDPTGSTLKHAVQTRNRTGQAAATRSGLIVASSCCFFPRVLTVYDRDGNAGESLQGPDGVGLYAAVDEQDRVYVASVDMLNKRVVIRLYDLDDLNLKERVEFNALDLKGMFSSWCYLVSLSYEMLAFACMNHLYFIKVSLE